jgi:hypothetical protein
MKEEKDCSHIVCPKRSAHICDHCRGMFSGVNIYKEHLGIQCSLSAAYAEQEWEMTPTMIGDDV